MDVPGTGLKLLICSKPSRSKPSPSCFSVKRRPAGGRGRRSSTRHETEYRGRSPKNGRTRILTLLRLLYTVPIQFASTYSTNNPPKLSPSALPYLHLCHEMSSSPNLETESLKPAKHEETTSHNHDSIGARVGEGVAYVHFLFLSVLFAQPRMLKLNRRGNQRCDETYSW
jgi:hypothetical protein